MLKLESNNKTFHGDIRTVLGKSCEVEKMMRFLKETEMFEEIFKKMRDS